MENKAIYDPQTGLFTINPLTPEEQAVQAEAAEKQRLEEEAFLKKFEQEREAKKRKQEAWARRKKGLKLAEEQKRYLKEVDKLVEQGYAEKEARAILGPFCASTKIPTNGGEGSIRF